MFVAVLICSYTSDIDRVPSIEEILVFVARELWQKLFNRKPRLSKDKHKRVWCVFGLMVAYLLYC